MLKIVYQSALGLKSDLASIQNCLANDEEALENFLLAQNDISERFDIPQKLYGRESDINILLSAFHNVSDGVPQILAISGSSGIGKSALVHEVHKPLSKKNGLFISGKFDQYQKRVPYSALKTALKSWIHHKIALPASQLETLREKLKAVLSVNLRLLVDFIPEFAAIIGDIPQVKDLDASENEVRFLDTFQKFIQCISEERPLILFIDDIQWADQGTLNLLPLLTSEAGAKLLIIVAYRDNEIDQHHPVRQMFERMKHVDKRQGCLQELWLGPLEHKEISRLLQDTLHIAPENQSSMAEIESLAKLFFTKTGGNPFFINELLLSLYKEKLFNFDLASRRWNWDLNQINQRGLTDNIVKLLLGKMNRLPKKTQALIQYAACVGRNFDLDILANSMGEEEKSLTKKIWPALSEGVLIQESVTKAVSNVSSNQHKEEIVYESSLQEAHQLESKSSSCHSIIEGKTKVSYRFLHDRMQQAAYESLEELEQKRIHLKLGNILLQRVPEGTLANLKAESVFALVEQYNQASDLITDKSEITKLVELNLLAAWNAKKANVWTAAANYAGKGIALLEDEAWRNHYETCKQLYLLKAECDDLIGASESSNLHYDILYAKVEDNDLRAQICASRLVTLIGRGNWKDALGMGLKGLNYLGMNVPNDKQLESAIEVEWLSIKNNSIQGLIELKELPKTASQRDETIAKISYNLSIGYGLTGNTRLRNYFALKSASLVLSGQCVETVAMQLSCYAAYYLRQTNHLSLAFKQTKVVIELAEKYPSSRDLVNAYNTSALLIWYLKAPLEECVQLHTRAYALGMENGELGRALISRSNALALSLSKGDRLKRVSEKALENMALLSKKAIFHSLNEVVYKYTQVMLFADDNTFVDWEGKFDKGLLPKITGTVHEGYFLHYGAELAFWYSNEAEALKYCERIESQEAEFFKSIIFVEHIFLHCLLLLRKDKPTVQEQITLEQNLALVVELAKLNPDSFKHRYLLLEAETAKQNRSNMETVVECYRLAIESAKEGGFIQYEALANEFCAEYMSKIKQAFIAQAYIQRAYRCYKEWGCKAKENNLEERYQLFTGSSTSLKSPGQAHSSDYGASYSLIGDYDGTSSSSLHQGKSRSNALDLLSVIRSSQAIAGELELHSLIKKVIQVIVENAGAKLAILVIKRDDGEYIEAHVDKTRDTARYLQHQKLNKLDRSEQRSLPLGILNVTLRTGELVQLHNAQKEGDLQDDEYIQRYQVKSALCLPITYRDAQLGALYLENNLTSSAFDKNRVELLQVLLTQAAISFENARLFSEVSDLNTNLEQKVKRRTDELSQVVDQLQAANKELDAYARTVSHDLRAPIRFIRKYTEALKEELEFDHQLDDEKLFLVRKIMTSTNKMYELVTALLALSHVQQRNVERQKVNLSEIVDNFFEEMRERFPEQNVIVKGEKNIVVLADLGMIKSLMENLISNAWKYSSKKKQAEISFGQLEAGADIPPGVGVVPDKIPENYAIFYIRDNGDGFQMESAKELFGSFQRMHTENEFEGTGVGLATGKRVIEKHGGTIWVEAYKGEGATFYFTLPLAE